jgi:hypothetical protein
LRVFIPDRAFLIFDNLKSFRLWQGTSLRLNRPKKRSDMPLPGSDLLREHGPVHESVRLGGDSASLSGRVPGIVDQSSPDIATMQCR